MSVGARSVESSGLTIKCNQSVQFDYSRLGNILVSTFLSVPYTKRINTGDLLVPENRSITC
jgi:hypothetical protein